jgi:hypothetical protein
MYVCVYVCIYFIHHREEVSRAVSKMDKKTIEGSISVMRKRLDKHFSGFVESSVRN